MGDGRPVTWRACAAALMAACAVPVVVPLVLLWLPLLCCAVAVIRFRRARTRRIQSCRGGGGGGGGRKGAVDAGDRLWLLQKYLEDQMELARAGAGEFFHDPREA